MPGMTLHTLGPSANSICKLVVASALVLSFHAHRRIIVKISVTQRLLNTCAVTTLSSFFPPSLRNIHTLVMHSKLLPRRRCISRINVDARVPICITGTRLRGARDASHLPYDVTKNSTTLRNLWHHPVVVPLQLKKEHRAACTACIRCVRGRAGDSHFGNRTVLTSRCARALVSYAARCLATPFLHW
jgi:hypothetical protein